MEDEGIEDGDLVVIRQEPDPKEGDLVIALDEENRNTLKKYGGKDRKTRKVILEYCNKAVYGDKKILVKHLVCQGVVSHIIKKGMEKVFVKVRCSHLPDGTIRPESLEWEDGQVWEITRTIHVAAPADHEFEGIRYTVLIGSAEKYIYRTGNRWYVEPVRMEVDSS